LWPRRQITMQRRWQASAGLAGAAQDLLQS
jgi:hypothetical protein